MSKIFHRIFLPWKNVPTEYCNIILTCFLYSSEELKRTGQLTSVSPTTCTMPDAEMALWSTCRLWARCPGDWSWGLPFPFSSPNATEARNWTQRPFPWLFPKLLLMKLVLTGISLKVCTVWILCYKRGREREWTFYRALRNKHRFISFHPTSFQQHFCERHIILLLSVHAKIIQ